MRETSTVKAPTTSADCVVGDVDALGELVIERDVVGSSRTVVDCEVVPCLRHGVSSRLYGRLEVVDVDDLDAHHVVPVSPVHNLVRKDASVSPVEVGDDHGLSPNGYIPELVVLDSCVGPHPQDMIISVGAVIIVGDIVVA